MNLNELVLAVQRGEETKLEELWLKVERFVWYCSRRYFFARQLPGIELDDLYQVGYFALLDAVRTYDPDRGAFLTHFAWRLRHSFHNSWGNNERRRRDPLNCAASLDAPLDSYDPDSGTLADIVPDPRDLITEVEERIYLLDLHAALQIALDGLPKTEADVLRSQFFREMTLPSIAKECGCTLSEIKKLRSGGLRRLRNRSVLAQLEHFIDERTDFYEPVESTVLYRERLRQQYK